jgi:hypothetical protein
MKRPRRFVAKAGWVDYPDGRRIYFRSKAERVHAGSLEMLQTAGAIASWEHEPYRFIFPGVTRGQTGYSPDFRVVMPDGEVRWEEVKGYWAPKDVQKLVLMARHYPGIVVRTFGAALTQRQAARIEAARRVAMGKRK